MKEQLNNIDSLNCNAKDMLPLNMTLIAEVQRLDEELKSYINHHQNQIGFIDLDGVDVVTAKRTIWDPQALQNQAIDWCHEHLYHPGVNWMLQTMQIHYRFPVIKTKIKQFVQSCDECQRHNIMG